MDPRELAKILQQNRGAVIYYDDASSWSLFKDVGELSKANPQPIAEGYDGDTNGYVPLMVQALALLTRHETDTV